MKVLVLVPARGGSKGLPGKNLRTVAGISLVGHAVRVGRNFLRAGALQGDVVIDTDSPAIAAEAARWGADAPFLRPAELATDASPTIDSTLLALDRLAAMERHYDVLVLLQPTSPLRSPDDVASCFAAYDPSREGVISVVAPDHPPAQALSIAADGAIDWRWPDQGPDRQRQQLTPLFRPSGAVYVASIASLRARRAFIVPGVTRGVCVTRERSVDVDSALDLALAQALAERRPIAALQIDARAVGAGEPCFVMARVQFDENSSNDALARVIDAVAHSGADAVHWVAQTGVGEPASHFPARVIPELLQHTRTRGLSALLSGSAIAGRGASGEADRPSGLVVDCAQFGDAAELARLATNGGPLLLRTAGADPAVIDQALSLLTEHGDPALGLLHAPGARADVREALTQRRDLQSAFGRPAGFADASPHGEFAIAAAATGAPLLEVPLSLIDAAAAVRFAEAVRAVRALDAAVTATHGELGAPS